MLTEEQIKKVEHSVKHGDATVIVVANKVYVANEVLKHHKEATVEFVDCNEVDESCFESDGEYIGEILPGEKTIIVADAYPESDCVYASYYYEDEVKVIEK